MRKVDANQGGSHVSMVKAVPSLIMSGSSHDETKTIRDNSQGDGMSK